MQSAKARCRKRVVVLFFLILFLNSLEMARVLPMMDKATRPGRETNVFKIFLVN